MKKNTRTVIRKLLKKWCKYVVSNKDKDPVWVDLPAPFNNRNIL